MVAQRDLSIDSSAATTQYRFLAKQPSDGATVLGNSGVKGQAARFSLNTSPEEAVQRTGRRATELPASAGQVRHERRHLLKTMRRRVKRNSLLVGKPDPVVVGHHFRYLAT